MLQPGCLGLGVEYLEYFWNLLGYFCQVRGNLLRLKWVKNGLTMDLANAIVIAEDILYLPDHLTNR